MRSNPRRSESVVDVEKAPQVQNPKFKRRHAPKVRTGCLTCKQRRIKCDETKPNCQRCLSSRTSCAGYVKPTPSKAPRILACREQFSKQTFSGSVALLNNRVDQEYYDLYMTEFAHTLNGYFAGRLWSMIFPKAAQSHTSILHMILAISGALSCRRAVRKCDQLDASRHSQFALSQYQKSKQLSLAELSVDHGQSSRILVITYILEACYEAVMDNPSTSSNHLQTGYTLISNWVDTNRRQQSTGPFLISPMVNDVEHEFITTASILDLQVLQHQDEKSAIEHEELREVGATAIAEMPGNFSDIGEARAYWLLIQRRCAHFVRSITSPTEQYISQQPTPGHAASSHAVKAEQPSMTQMRRIMSGASVISQTSSASSLFTNASTEGVYDASRVAHELSILHDSQSLPAPTQADILLLHSLFDPAFTFAPAIIHFNQNPIHGSLSPEANGHHRPDVVDPYNNNLMPMYKKYTAESLRWRLSFSHIYSRVKKSNDTMLIAGANVLFVQCIASDIELSTVLSLMNNAQSKIHPDCTAQHSSQTHGHQQIPANAPLNDYREIVTTSRRVVEARKDQQDVKDSDFMFDTGISHALHVVIYYCPDLDLRREAYETLKVYGVQEGVWNCLTMVEAGMQLDNNDRAE